MAISLPQSTIPDYNANTISIINTLLNRMLFVWSEPDSLITDKIIGYSTSQWKQVSQELNLPVLQLAGASFSIDLNNSNIYTCSLTQNVVISDILHFDDGEELYIIFHQDIVGNREVSWPSGVILIGEINLNLNANNVTLCQVTKVGTEIYLVFRNF